ncbi:hypothetical protein [Gordonia sp. VNK21]|uniref:hypothetical protein n=1 Tax=Gordonia sp. VNK21 TaxID=3382483 RepID=UPI0038D3BF37
MSATRSTGKILATLLFGAALPLALAACGDEEEAPSAHSATSSSTEVAAPSDREVPTVGGPNPSDVTPTSAESEETTERAGTACGTARGPEGPLHVQVVDGSVDCTTVKKIADKYGPLMYKGGEQDIDGWTCAPSTAGEGELSRCTKGDDVFALAL